MAVRLRAPELSGRGWLNTGGRELTLADLRGKVVVLDFWTFCCVNCLHVLDELRPLEERFGDALVVIGVHSPKFVHEADPAALAAAVERYAVHHPVLDDPDLVTWQAYTARAWPTLVVIDPEGHVVASMSGEGHAHGLTTLVEDLLAEHAHKGTLRTGEHPYVSVPAAATSLRFPSKALVLADGSVLVSDTAHHEIAWLEPDLATERGRYDGVHDPQGMCLLPDDVAARVGYDVVVADAAGHRLHGLRLDGAGSLGSLGGVCRPVAGTGTQLRERSGAGAALAQDLSTPWDVAWWQGRVVVAMAGTHQLWWFDPETQQVGVLAGTSAEGIRDGALGEAWFAQPSGLSVAPDGALWVADAETSALRRLTLDAVQTVVGKGLFDFGHRDGPADQALLQHPLGLVALEDRVLVADTYNGAVRQWCNDEMSTVATGLVEPSDVVVRGREVLVVESAAHAVRAVPVEVVATEGFTHRTQRPSTTVAAGVVTLDVTFVPPSGQKLDRRWGDPTQLMVSATPQALLREGAGTAQGLTRRLVVDPAVGDGVLHVSVRAAACDGDASGEVPEHAACHLYQQDWGMPIVVADGGADRIVLDLRAE